MCIQRNRLIPLSIQVVGGGVVRPSSPSMHHGSVKSPMRERVKFKRKTQKKYFIQFHGTRIHVFVLYYFFHALLCYKKRKNCTISSYYLIFSSTFHMYYIDNGITHTYQNQGKISYSIKRVKFYYIITYYSISGWLIRIGNECVSATLKRNAFVSGQSH